ncbi:SRPBCC domain-containing protein [Streptomyces sp. NPDC003077]|uniref:SRPBCC domain-containing protein n=1 Tax=Streptomyces sp. NPDC003077 TaxID=3154443 RepID=UPI0033A41AE6
MEHEVHVPFPLATVRQALTDPERVTRCVPGLQLDADAAPGTPQGRLRLRIGSSTITYRGTLTLTASDPSSDTVTVQARGTEARGDGSAEASLTVRLKASAAPETDGTTLVCTGTVRSEGRLAEATEQVAEAAGRRLLDRFAANLTADLTDFPVEDEPAAGRPDDADAPVTNADADEPPAAGPPVSGGPGAADFSRVFDSEVPPPSLDPLAEEEIAGIAPAEAAHARRTMIGRSAEEVDHAPPRGRYAPVAAPQSSTPSVLRWAAPAAAVALASAVVVGRVLRRRR